MRLFCNTLSASQFHTKWGKLYSYQAAIFLLHVQTEPNIKHQAQNSVQCGVLENENKERSFNFETDAINQFDKRGEKKKKKWIKPDMLFKGSKQAQCLQFEIVWV